MTGHVIRNRTVVKSTVLCSRVSVSFNLFIDPSDKVSGTCIYRCTVGIQVRETRPHTHTTRMCVCVCVCAVCAKECTIYIYIYIYTSVSSARAVQIRLICVNTISLAFSRNVHIVSIYKDHTVSLGAPTAKSRL